MKAIFFAGLLLLSAGCTHDQQSQSASAFPTHEQVNPSFPVSIKQAGQAIDEMRKNPFTLERPLVIIGGYNANVSPAVYKLWFDRAFEPKDKIITISVALETNFDACRKKVIETLDKKFPSPDPNFTTEVDVLGISMGGLVGRYAASPSNDPKNPRRLKIHTLFTISSPHNGARMADTTGFTTLQKDMHSGSAFLKRLAETDATATYELVPYVQLNDEIVGPENAAPPGKIPWWQPKSQFLPSHLGAMTDDRILADICRRLRGEEPFTKNPPAPLP